MKKDQYLQHDVTALSNTKIMRLVHREHMEGYGIYWRLLEHLRGQEQYTDSLEIVEILAQGMNVAAEKVMRIIKDYELFTVQSNSFSSPGLCRRMEKLDERREKQANAAHNTNRKLAEKKRNERLANAVEDSRAEESKGKNSSIIRDNNPVHAAVGIKTNWEKCVDDLSHEQMWCELMAMRSGMKERFMEQYPAIIQCFKNHIRSYGKEASIFTLSDAKNYFSNYISPGTTTHAKLMAQLNKTKENDPYRYEYISPEGKRSYCGLPIPDDAPPRPGSNALWNGRKWE